MRAVLISSVCLAAQPAWAQTPQPSNADIMRAIDALNSQVKELKQENDRLKKQKPAASKAADNKVVAPPASPPGKAVPGWFVNIIPWTEDLKADAIAGIPGPMFDFDFDLHTRYLPDQSRYIYHGVSYFHPPEDGDYSFSIFLEPVATPANYGLEYFNCSGEMSVNGNRVITGVTRFEQPPYGQKDVYRTQTFYSSPVRLAPEAGKGFKVEFRTDCWHFQNRNATYLDRLLPSWKKNRFRVMVRTPADMTPRPFRPDELYYVGKP